MGEVLKPQQRNTNDGGIPTSRIVRRSVEGSCLDLEQNQINFRYMNFLNNSTVRALYNMYRYVIFSFRFFLLNDFRDDFHMFGYSWHGISDSPEKLWQIHTLLNAFTKSTHFQFECGDGSKARTISLFICPIGISTKRQQLREFKAETKRAAKIQFWGATIYTSNS